MPAPAPAPIELVSQGTPQGSFMLPPPSSPGTSTTSPASPASPTPPPSPPSPPSPALPRTGTPAPVLLQELSPLPRAPTSSGAFPSVSRLADPGEVAEVPRASSRVFVKPEGIRPPSRSLPPAAETTSSASSTGVIDFGPLAGEAAAVAAALPPFLAGEVLRFHTMADFRAGVADLKNLGAVLAVSDERPPAGKVGVRLSVAGTEGTTSMQVTVSMAQAGSVVVQAVDRSVIDAIAAEFATARTSTPAPSAGASTGLPEPSRSVGRALILPLSGRLWNPTTPTAIMNQPVHRPITAADLERPSLPLFLRWLRTRKGVVRVELVAAGQPTHTFVIVDGREVRSPVSLQTLGRSLAAPEFTYEVIELPRPPALTHTGRTLHLIVEALRALLALHDVEAIAAAFPHTSDPRLVRAVPAIAEALGFQGPHARLVKSSLEGDDTVAAVTRGASGARVAWDVLVSLDLFGGLGFVAGVPRRSTPGTMASATAPPNEARTLMAKDHFGVLGLHWSSSPSEIAPAWQRARAAWAGPRRPADPADAAAVLERIDEAFTVLNGTESRRAYRRATYNMVWVNQAQILVGQAKLALYRKDVVEARNLLTAAEDLASTPEGVELLAVLNR